MCHRPWLEWRTHRTSARRSQAAAGTEQMAPASLAAAGPSKESAWFEVSFPCARTCRACACKAPLPLPEPLGRAPAGSAPPPPAFTPPRERPLPPSARVRAPRPRRAASFLRRRPPGAGGRHVALRAAPPQRAPARGGWVGPPCASSRAAFCGAPFGAAGHIRSQGTRDRAPKLTVPIRFVWLYRISGHQRAATKDFAAINFVYFWHLFCWGCASLLTYSTLYKHHGRHRRLPRQGRLRGEGCRRAAPRHAGTRTRARRRARRTAARDDPTTGRPRPSRWAPCAPRAAPLCLRSLLGGAGEGTGRPRGTKARAKRAPRARAVPLAVGGLAYVKILSAAWRLSVSRSPPRLGRAPTGRDCLGWRRVALTAPSPRARA